MCNGLHVTTNQEAITDLLEGWNWRHRRSDQSVLPWINPTDRAPVVRLVEGALQLNEAIWGMPTPPQYLVTRPREFNFLDRGVPNIGSVQSPRWNISLPYWRQWLGVRNRCLVPFTQFRLTGLSRHYHYFEFADHREVAFIAGICDGLTRQVKFKDPGPTTGLFFSLLSTSSNEAARAIYSKKMPVILTTPEEWRTWLTAEWPTAEALLRPLADGLLCSTPVELSSWGEWPNRRRTSTTH